MHGIKHFAMCLLLILTIIIIDNYSSIVWSEDPTSQWSCHGQHDTEVLWNFWDRVVED